MVAHFSTLQSTDPGNIIPLVVIILLIVILILGVLGQYFECNCFKEYLLDDDDDNPGLSELNRVYRKEDDLEYQAHLNDDHDTWKSSPSMEPLSPPPSIHPPPISLQQQPPPEGISTVRSFIKQSSSVMQSSDKRDLLKSKPSLRATPSYFRSKSSFRQKRLRTFWDDRLSKLNTPQIISMLLGVDEEERKIGLEGLTISQASRIVTVLNAKLADKKGYWRADMSSLLALAREIPDRKKKIAPDLHVSHSLEDRIPFQKKSTSKKMKKTNSIRSFTSQISLRNNSYNSNNSSSHSLSGFHGSQYRINLSGGESFTCHHGQDEKDGIIVSSQIKSLEEEDTLEVAVISSDNELNALTSSSSHSPTPKTQEGILTPCGEDGGEGVIMDDANSIDSVDSDKPANMIMMKPPSPKVATTNTTTGTPNNTTNTVNKKKSVSGSLPRPSTTSQTRAARTKANSLANQVEAKAKQTPTPRTITSSIKRGGVGNIHSNGISGDRSGRESGAVHAAIEKRSEGNHKNNHSSTLSPRGKSVPIKSSKVRKDETTKGRDKTSSTTSLEQHHVKQGDDVIEAIANSSKIKTNKGKQSNHSVKQVVDINEYVRDLTPVSPTDVGRGSSI